MKVLTGVYWGAGAVKEINEDSIALEQVVTSRGRVVLALVCDGIGGLPQGEVASGYVAEEAVKWFYQRGVKLIGAGKGWRQIRKSLLYRLGAVKREMLRYGKRNGLQMGSTMSLLLLWRHRYQIFHLGDSRIYLCQRKIRQLTSDHGNGRELNRCIGSFRGQKPDVFGGKFYKKSGFLLCSDGFRNRIEPAQLAEIFMPRKINTEVQIEARLREVAEYDMKQGEQDNISAIYLKII